MTTRTTLGLLAAVTMIATIGAPALATDEPDPEAPIAVDLIEGLPWVLLRQQVDGAMTELPDGAVVTLLMENGSVTGNGGCNDYFGTYELSGDALTFSEIGATEMYCLDTGDLEVAYFANLLAVTNGFSTGGTLVMSDADGAAILEFGPADLEPGPIPTDGIEGLSWQLDAVVLPGTGELTAVPADVAVSIVLEDGQASGSGGCNGFSASYELEGTALSFGPAVSTKMACPDPVMEFESAFFSQLEAVAGWASDGGSVTFFGADGAELAHFVPALES